MELSLTKRGSRGGCRASGPTVSAGYTKCGADCCGNTQEGCLTQGSGKASQRKIGSFETYLVPIDSRGKTEAGGEKKVHSLSQSRPPSDVHECPGNLLGQRLNLRTVGKGTK